MVESERQEIQPRLAAEQLRGLVDFARDVLKLVTLINGGAAIALLAFAGVVRSTQSSDSSLDGSLIIWAIGVFTFGVLLSSIGAVAGYITQYKYFQEAIGNVPVGGAKCWHITALIFVPLSLLILLHRGDPVHCCIFPLGRLLAGLPQPTVGDPSPVKLPPSGLGRPDSPIRSTRTAITREM